MFDIVVNIDLAEKKGLNYAVMYAVLFDAIRANKGDDGFAVLTAEYLQQLTTLTRRQQNPVIDEMIRDGLIEVEKRGVPCRRYFKITGTV